MEKENLPGRALQISDRIMKTANAWKDKYEVIGDVRGIGAMLGIEFVTDKKSKTPNTGLVNAVVNECAQNGLLVESAGTYGNCIRFLAPLVITDAQIDAGLEILEKAIVKCK
jgi:4-aminobutyrate aminotransferase/(S)-3-amino-2-methylpropionate transaminase